MTRGLLPLMLGFTLWSAGFIGLYGLQGLGCAWGWEPALHRTLLILVYLLSLAALAGVIAVQYLDNSHPPTLPQRAGLALSVCALAASIIIFAPTLFTTLCV